MDRPPRRPWIPDELPRIRGVGWWVFLTIWGLAFAAAAFGTIAPLWEAWQQEAEVSPSWATGLGLRTDAEGRTVIAYPHTDEAARAGIAPGQRIVAIDGKRVVGREDVLDRLRGDVGTIARVETIAPDGRRAEHRLTRDPDHLREAYRKAHLRRGIVFAAEILARFISFGLLPLICAALLLLRRTGDRFAPWASLALVFYGLGIGEAAFWYGGNDVTSAVFRVLNGSAVVTLLLTLALFPDGRFASRRMKIVSFLAIALVISSTGSSLAVGNTALATALILSVLIIADRMRHSTVNQEVQQIRWVLFGFVAAALALFLWVVADMFRTNAWSVEVEIWAILIGALFLFANSALLLAGITVGLLRYRLYDADATISRSVAYGFITLFLLGIFAGSEKAVELLGEGYFGKSFGALAGVLGAAMAAICIGPIHHRVTHWAEKRFRSGLVLLRHGLPLAVGDMRETATPAALADAVLQKVESGVRARYGAVVVDGAVLDARHIDGSHVVDWMSRGILPVDGGGRLHVDHRDPLFPLRVPLAAGGAGLVGWLLLGARPDGSLYGREERAALHEVADPVARALAITIERERRDTARREREHARDREIGRLGQIVLRLQERIGWEPSGDPGVAR